jgi:hypothetical protein
MRAFAAILVFVLAPGVACAQDLSGIEQTERQRWLAEDLYMQQQYRLRRGTPPSDISQRSPEQKRLVDEMMALRTRRISEVQDALRRYCPSGEPPCVPEPPRYVLEQAMALGLIEPVASTGEPRTQCFGLVDPDGPTSMECYQRR